MYIYHQLYVNFQHIFKFHQHDRLFLNIFRVVLS